jgi:predicted metal-binding protein
MENRYDSLMEKAVALGADEAKLIDTDQITFDPRSHLKCRFGCNRWVDSGPVPPI